MLPAPDAHAVSALCAALQVEPPAAKVLVHRGFCDPAAANRFLHPAFFYVEYALLMGVYAAAAFGLFVFVAGEKAARRWPVFVALFLLVHAALPRWASYHFLGQDYPWYLQAGVAGQYVLGPVLQPSAFVVLLVAAVCLLAAIRAMFASCSSAVM